MAILKTKYGVTFPNTFSSASSAVIRNDDVIWDLDLEDLSASPELDHRIISKSIVASDDNNKNPNGKDGMIAAEPGTGSAVESGKQHLRGKQQANNDDNVEVEEFVDKIIAARPDAVHLIRIRNSSELHIDNHNEPDTEDVSIHPKKNSTTSPTDFMQSIVFLEKPFHFHIPIVSDNLQPSYNDEKTGDDDDDKSKEEHNSKSLTDNRRRHVKQPKRKNSFQSKKRFNVHDDDEENEEEHKNLAPRSLGSKETVAVASEAVVPPPSSGSDSQKLQQAQPNIDQLIEQYPKLVPSIDRKRQSENGKANKDRLEEEGHLSLIDVPASDAEKFNGAERNIKTIDFSQDLVDSILGHEDDFLKYQNKIKSHADKLGVHTADMLHAIVYGYFPPSSNSTAIKKKIIETDDVHGRRQQFRKLFLEDPEEPKPNTANANPTAHAPNFTTNGIKVVKRTKRGLGKWLKKIFHRGDNNQAASTTMPPPRQKKVQVYHDQSRSKPVIFKVDENGDTDVDLLLPKAFRRSTYLQKKDGLKVLQKEEAEFEAEYAKSEEKDEQRWKAGSGPGSRGRSKRDVEQKHRKFSLPPPKNITSMSQDELLLVAEMVLNVVEALCEDVNRTVVLTTLENFRAILEKIVGTSSLPSFTPREEPPIQTLFSQLLACTESLSRSHGGPPPRDTSSNGNQSDFSSDDSSLRRTKRVRRGPGEPVEEEISPSKNLDESLKETVGDESESDEDANLLRPFLQRFVMLHLYLYKLTWGACNPYLEKQLLHDSNLIFLREFYRLSTWPSVDRKKEVYETFQKYPIDFDTAYEVFNHCFTARS